MISPMSTAALSGGGPSPGAPVANFSISNTDPDVGDPVTFTDTSLNSPTNWDWKQGGVTFSILQNPTYYFPTPGAYLITLTASNAFGSNTTPAGSFVYVHAPGP